MIDRLSRAAVRMRPLKWPALAMSLLLLAVAGVIVLRSTSYEDDYYLIPSLAGFLWFLSLYGMIEGFQKIPRVAVEGDPLVQRIKIRLYRLVFWFFGLLFLSTTTATVVLTSRMVRIWWRDFG